VDKEDDMAKTARKNRKRNARRRDRERRASMRGDGLPMKIRNHIVLHMIEACKGGLMKDRKKEANRKACRTKVSDNGE
jgi:hypothetical protein